jgi:hypothetical protein
MTLDDLLKLPEELIEQAHKAIEERRRAAYVAAADATEARIRQADAGKGDFKPLELHYAGVMRCMCGHGMAYPGSIGMGGAWYCSAILKGVADTAVMHLGPHPFSFWSIKSEDQCYRVGGASTRPPDEPLRDFTVKELARWGGTPPPRVVPSPDLPAAVYQREEHKKAEKAAAQRGATGTEASP